MSYYEYTHKGDDMSIKRNENRQRTDNTDDLEQKLQEYLDRGGKITKAPLRTKKNYCKYQRMGKVRLRRGQGLPVIDDIIYHGWF